MKNWSVIENQYIPEEIPYKETIFTIGNGYLGTRGTFEEAYPGQQAVTLINGLFDDAPLVHTELVNVPNWHNMEIIVNDDRFSLLDGQILQYERVLELHTGVLKRSVLWQTPQGNKIQITIERFASLADAHVVALRTRIKAVDSDCVIKFRSGLIGFVDNAGLVHWNLVKQGRAGETDFYLTVKTKQTGMLVSEAASLNVTSPQPVTYDFWDAEWSPQLVATSACKCGEMIVIDKLVTIYTSLDSDSVESDALTKLEAAKCLGYDNLRLANDEEWSMNWEKSNITIEGDDDLDLAIRFSIFQLLISAPRWSDRVSIPAKTLSGYGYRGHVFWDTEIFMLPFYIYTQPDIARNMLMYRYNTLNGARRKARQNGYQGAMYAWESAGTGDETTPRWIPVWNKESNEDELVRIWCGDIELHITADVAYGLMEYWQATKDDDFMRQYGAEIILDTALFWGSRVEYRADLERYEISDVIGPDEYHDHIDNSAFTNAMVRWHLRSAIHIAQWLLQMDAPGYSQITQKIGLTDEIIKHWENVADLLTLNMDEKTGLIEQFDGFFQLEDIDWHQYENRKSSMQAILGIEETQLYQILKQPDVLMLLYLLSEEYTLETFKANWEYYTPRTDHSFGSSLGPAIQAALAARMGELDSAYTYLQLGARTDLKNNRGNTADGIHGATAGGLWQAIVFGIAGIRRTENGLVAEPNLLNHWRRLKFRLCWQDEWIVFSFTN